LGAAETVNPNEVDVVKTIQQITSGGVDVTFEIIGKPTTLEQAFSVVRPSGKLVVVGYSAENWNLRASRVMFREISVLGSFSCRLAEYPTIISMIASRRLKLEPTISERLALEAINEALKRLEEGKVVGSQIVMVS
jgi:threonine dehydrogenase-like Zn-dependent dehydrogenase